jgi:hypothetical protein
VNETYSIIIFSEFNCSGFFSARIDDATFIVGVGVAMELGAGVAMEVGVARFIGIDMDEDMGTVEVAGKSTP